MKGAEDRARDHLASALSDSLGRNADPSVGFLKNSRHLQLSLAAARFAKSSDSVFAGEAKQIAGFALRRYENSGGLDSITVLDRDPVAQGVWKIHRMHTFGVEELRNVR
jgi:hypothetical protein